MEKDTVLEESKPSGPPMGPPPPQANTQYNPQDYAQPSPAGPVVSQPINASAEPPIAGRLNVATPPPLPPRRSADLSDSNESPIHFTRDPKRLTAYLVPFPSPASGAQNFPLRFMIYTPPAPPLGKPAEGEKESKVHKVQRKWQEEVRAAKKSDAKTKSWQGIRAGATKGISNLMGKTTTSSIDFLGRLGADSNTQKEADREGEAQTKSTVALEELILLYPSTMQQSPSELRREFVESMMRTKTKAQRDAVIATGLLPVAEAVDLLATFVWPFGGLMEIDAVWAYGNIRGAKTARSVTKRLASTGDDDGGELHLSFTPSDRIEILSKYLTSRCHGRDASMFPQGTISPTETEILQAIGWHPSQTGGEIQNWEDEQWETQEVKDDLKNVMTKAAAEWVKWCKAFEKDPEKASKK